LTRIIKPTNFFKRYHQLIIGTFWLLAGIVILILQEGVTSYLYIPVGLGMIIYGYLSKDKIQEFIAWDASKIIVKDPGVGEKIFPLEAIDNIFISNNHLTIKSGAANGTMIDLKGFKEEDINLLQKNFNKFSHLHSDQFA